MEPVTDSLARTTQARPSPEHKSTSEVARLLGVTYRELDNWIRLGYIPGLGRPGSGFLRWWTLEQIARARQLAEASRLRRLRLDDIVEHLQRRAEGKVGSP